MSNIKQLIRDYYRLEEQIAAFNALLARSKEKIQAYFDNKNIDCIEVEPDERTSGLIAKKVERTYITYDADKLKEKLNKEVFNEIAIKTHTIINMEGLIQLLKNAGITPSEFKKYISTTYSVDKEKIKQLYSVGEITLKDLEGCYSSKIVKSIQIREGKCATN